MKRILVIADNYPSHNNPNRGVFVYNLIQEFTKYYKVDVIAPVVYKFIAKEKPLKSEKANVIYPKFLSFSKIQRNYFSIRFISEMIKEISILKCIRSSQKYEFVYCHFLSSATPVLNYFKTKKIPLYVALGESSLEVRYKSIFNNYSYLKSIGRNISGIISVSDKLKVFSENRLQISKKNIFLSPNAVDTNMFKPINVDRKFLGLKNDDFVISFTGAFIERKGIKILLNAIKDIDNVKLILIGSGDINYLDEKIAFKGSLPHYKIPNYLNASDIFVFPTKAEGSSNAIAEAMACGLPIITSNVSEIVFQIGLGNAIFLDPNDDLAFKAEIQKLIKNKNLRKNLSQKSLEIGKNRTIEKRANNIINWIKNHKKNIDF